MELGIIITIISSIVVAVVSHFIAVGKLKDRLHQNEIEIEKLKHRDELQQQVIDQIGKQNDVLLPKLLDKLNDKGYGRK